MRLKKNSDQTNATIKQKRENMTNLEDNVADKLSKFLDV